MLPVLDAKHKSKQLSKKLEPFLLQICKNGAKVSIENGEYIELYLIFPMQENRVMYEFKSKWHIKN